MRRTFLFIWLLLVLIAFAGTADEWEFEIGTDTYGWNVHDLISCYDGRNGDASPTRSTTGIFSFHAYDRDPSVDDHSVVSVQLSVVQVVADWRGLLGVEEDVDERTTTLMDLLAPMEPTAVVLQVVGIGCGGPTAARQLSGHRGCTGWGVQLFGEQELCFEFENCIVYLAPGNASQVTGGFYVRVSDDGCDSWNDGGVVSSGPVSFTATLSND